MDYPKFTYEDFYPLTGSRMSYGEDKSDFNLNQNVRLMVDGFFDWYSYFIDVLRKNEELDKLTDFELEGIYLKDFLKYTNKYFSYKFTPLDFGKDFENVRWDSTLSIEWAIDNLRGYWVAFSNSEIAFTDKEDAVRFSIEFLT